MLSCAQKICINYLLMMCYFGLVCMFIEMCVRFVRLVLSSFQALYKRKVKVFSKVLQTLNMLIKCYLIEY